MFMPATTGLNIIFNSQQQHHTPLPEDHYPITTQSFFGTSAPSNSDSLRTHIDLVDNWAQEFFNSSDPSHSPWPATSYQDTPLLSSPNMTAGHPHQQPHYDSTPVLYSSPGTSVSTRCDTPSSVTSGAEDMKPRISSLGFTPMTTAHVHNWGYATTHNSPSMHDAALVATTYDTHFALLESTTCSPPEHSIYETSDLEYVKEEVDDTTLMRLSQPNSEDGDEEIDEETRKIRIMEERTALKRKRLAPLVAGGEKPQCPKCHKAFSRKHNLRQHQLTSCSLLPSRARDYECGQCSKTFHRQTDLQRHKASVCTFSLAGKD
jgi:hypothetical protein